MSKPCYVLGISCFYHDSAVTLLKDGEVFFAAHEERYTRTKQDDRFPRLAIEHALRFAGITMRDIAAVAYYEKPLLKFFDRIVPESMRVWPRGFLQYHHAMHEWMQKKLWIPAIVERELGYKGPLYFVPHHESHAASAFYVSGFAEAAVVTVDGVGEWATTTIGEGKGTDLCIHKEIHFPHSLGLLYSAITYYLGFRVNSAEYKVMGLAPYGEPRYRDVFSRLIDVRDDGSFCLNMDYFTYEYAQRMTGRAMEQLFSHPRRIPESPLTQFHKDVARSLQEVTDDVMLKIAAFVRKTFSHSALCLAGGVALNCVSNGKILRSGIFQDIFVQPASGDAGGSLGAALTVWHKCLGGKRSRPMQHAFLGNEYMSEEIESFLRVNNIPHTYLDDAQLFDAVADLLQGTNVIGWFQGRMEFGPRSLGSRSIIADARSSENWQKVNLKIKFRESFRPFAPTVLEEEVSHWFALDRASPYMLIVADTLPGKRSVIPAVTHVDGSARIQTITRGQHPRYYDLLRAFFQKTGCPVIINTSFNVRGEPIVESPADAFNTFVHTDMDYLVLGNYLLRKSAIGNVDEARRKTYLASYALD